MTPAGTDPESGRLEAAIDAIIDRLAPDQIILFGSAARGEMTPESDLDLLVISNEKNEGAFTRHERWDIPQAGGQVDVVVTNRATAERNRLSAAYVQGAALEEGRTVYRRDGAIPTATGPSWTRDGHAIVRTTRYRPDGAAVLLKDAEDYWAVTEHTPNPRHRCQFLHAAVEHAFKAIIVADGRRVEHVHDLDHLWRQAEATGERIGAVRNPQELEQLTRYAGNLGDEPRAEEVDPHRTWENSRTTAEDVLDHARRRVPRLITRTIEALANHGAAAAHQRGETAPENPVRQAASRSG